MSELKNCPHCNKVMTQDNFYSEDGYPQGCHCWEDCNTSEKAEEIWNTRPIEDKYKKALEKIIKFNAVNNSGYVVWKSLQDIAQSALNGV
jgi:hypothetical protein